MDVAAHEPLRLTEISAGMKQTEARLSLAFLSRQRPFRKLHTSAIRFSILAQTLTPDGPKYTPARYDVDTVIPIATKRNHVCAYTDTDGEVRRIQDMFSADCATDHFKI